VVTLYYYTVDWFPLFSFSDWSARPRHGFGNRRKPTAWKLLPPIYREHGDGLASR